MQDEVKSCECAQNIASGEGQPGVWIEAQWGTTPFNFQEYQEGACKTFKPHASEELRKANWAIGLGNEAGEVQGLIKHDLFHQQALTDAELAKELGDVLWYVAALCETYGLDMGAVAELNLAKLEHRHGQQFSFTGSAQRHEKEQKFTETERYKEIMGRIKRT